MLPTIPKYEPARGVADPGEDSAGGTAVAVRAAPSPAIALPLAPSRGPEQSADVVVCDCLQVRLGTLQQCIARGCTTVAALARETGVTTACGGCLPRVAALVNEETGGPVRISGVRKVRPDVRSFRFEPLDPVKNPVQPFRPGQHVVVSGLIGNEWISRPYTLTSPAGGGHYWEVTVKLDPGGTLSPWLFGRGREFTAIHLTHPRGDYFVELERPEPVVFLVGGIGITPALGVARSVAAAGSRKRLHIDYSARAADDLAFRDELEGLAEAHENITVRFRVTGEGERLRPADAERYARALPGAHFYLCGPDAYQTAAREHLAAARVGAERVHAESFRPAARPTRESTAIPRRTVDIASLAVGLVLLLAYLAQGALGLHWARLEALQEVESYRRWSGAVLLSFIAAQWILPGLRLRELYREAAKAYPWHRWLGAFAPVFFYAHATRTGFGYLLALSSVYLANVLVGLLDKTIVRDPARRERYGRLWLAPHVALACLTVALALFHIFVVFAYR